MSGSIRLPFHLSPDGVDPPPGWSVTRIVDAYEQLPVGRRYDSKSVSENGRVPVIDQSLHGVLGYHDAEPGIVASPQGPVVTFANHTCAMRVMTSPFSVIQNVFPMVGRDGVCDTRYLYYATNGRQSTEDYKGHHPAWRNSFIELPDLRIQHAIVEMLEPFDDLIENNRRRVEVLEEMARAIYREWFVYFRFPGHERVDLVDSALGVIPAGWVVSTCGDELAFIGGGTPSKKVETFWDSGTVPWYTPSDLTKERWRYAAPPELRITEAGVAKSSARKFPSGSVLMTSRATLGVLAIATAEATTNQGFIVMLPDGRWSPGYIREWLAAHEVELAAIGTGATFKEITKGALKRFPLVVPSRNVLDEHRRATDPLEAEIENLEREIRVLSGLRDLLLPKLVTGQIDISTLDLDVMVEGAVA